MELRESKKLANARQIKRAARDLFLDRGVENTTMDQVAAAAGVSRASLFNYYPGKAALLDGLGDDMESRLVQAVNHYAGKHDDAREAVRQLFAFAGQVLEQTAGLTRLLFMHASGGRGFPALHGAFIRLADAGQARGEWRRDLDSAQLGEWLYLAFAASLLDWCLDDERPAQLAHRADNLNRLFAAD
jgi:AcrR family transcriptional regulator